MKTLIFNGSPRKKGDTVCLINRLCEGLEGEVRVIDAYYTDISPCIDCRYCHSHSGCSINDGMNEVYDYIEECGNIVIASPLYFSELTGRLLDLGSRLQTYFCAKHFRGLSPIEKPKRGGVILVGGGMGKPEKAFGTAKILLADMNCVQIGELAGSFDTDRIPAAEDIHALESVDRLADFLMKK